MPEVTSLPITGTEWAMVAEPWSASASSAAPAQRSAPAIVPTGVTGKSPRPCPAVAVTAIQAAAPVIAW